MPDVRRFPVTNTRTQRPGAPAKPAGKPRPAAGSLEFLLAAGVPAANGASVVTSQAPQAAAAALVQHQRLAVAGTQPAQASAAAGAQHQHLTVAGSQAAQQVALVSSSHEHLAVVTAQAAQSVAADLHSHVHLEAVTQQAPQASEMQVVSVAEELPVRSFAGHRVLRMAHPAWKWARNAGGIETAQRPQLVTADLSQRQARPVNAGSLATAQAPQHVQAECCIDRNSLICLYDLIDDDELAFAMLGVAS